MYLSQKIGGGRVRTPTPSRYDNHFHLVCSCATCADTHDWREHRQEATG